MKIITWNCNMAFRKKAAVILKQKPDILIVPECEHPDKLNFSKKHLKPSDVIWHGSNPHKGLGVFSYSHYRFKLLDQHLPDLKIILPLLVTGGTNDFMLFALWANNPDDKNEQYVTQVWKAIRHYDNLLATTQTILAGDFNSNTIWDKPRRAGNHSTVVARLEEKKIFSSYHRFYRCPQGEENHPTFYLYHHRDKPYHLDYLFASEDFIRKMEKVEVGRHHKWAHHSDHVPLSVIFSEGEPRR